MANTNSKKINLTSAGMQHTLFPFTIFWKLLGNLGGT